MKVLCILNPIAGGGRAAPRVASAVQKICKQVHISYDIVNTQAVGEGQTLAKQASQEGYTLVAAAGGDGTINEVATGLVGTDTALAIVPVGSGNGLARGLQIPLDPDDACKLIVQGDPKKIDVGQVCGRYFFATSGIGFDAHVGKVYNESPRHSRGLIPYFQIAVSEYFNYRPKDVSLRCNGKTFCYTPLILTVANTEQYGGGAIIAPGALPDDGLFDVSVILKAPMLSVVNQLPKLFSGEIDTFAHFRTHKAASLTITRPFPGSIHVDGESFTAGETLSYTMLHHGLTVQVPKASSQCAVSATSFHNATNTEHDVFQSLEKLAELKKKGIINGKEFQVQKQKLLERI